MEARGTVQAIAVQPDGKVVIGGEFTHVNGVRRNNIARLNADGTLDAAWNPDADSHVTALAATADTVYAVGFFGRIGGEVRRFLAALDDTTGAATAWNPNPDTVATAVVPVGGIVYVGGGFSTIGGATRRQIAALDAVTGAATAWNPNATLLSSNTAVIALAVSGNTVYAGGSFSVIGGAARSKLAALDAVTGNATAWNPNPTGAGDVRIREIAVAAGTVYVTGEFTAIGGQARTNLAALDAATGNATAWNPGVTPSNASFSALDASAGAVYLGGNFTSAGGATRSFLAALDPTTGAATAWNPSPDADVRAFAVANGTVHVGGTFRAIAGEAALLFARLTADTGVHVAGFRPAAGTTGTVSVLAEQSDGKIAAAGNFLWAGKAGVARRFLLRLNVDGTLDLGWNPAPERAVRALATSGTTVYAAGNFLTIGGAARNRIAALDGATGNATAWNPDADQPVTALAIDGATVYAGGGFTTIAGVARANLAALDAVTGAATAWAPALNGGVDAAALAGATLYVAGGFTVVDDALRIGLAALDTATGAATAWNPSPNGAVDELAVAGGIVYAGGLFTTIGGQARNRIAALDAATGAATAWDPDADGAVATVVAAGGTVYAGGGFTSIGGQARSRIAALDAALGSATTWDPDAAAGAELGGTTVLAQLVSASDVHAGGSFSRLLGEDRDGLAALSPSTGGGFAIGLSPATLDLGEQAVGTSGTGRTITVVNYGAAPVAIAGIVASGDFAQSNDCPATLAGGARCTIEALFAPTVIGLRSGAVTVTSDAPGSPHVAALSGLATEVGQLCCQLSVEGCSGTVSTGSSATRTSSFTRVDLPPPSPTATGPSVQVGEFLVGSATSTSRNTLIGPATILTGEDQGQVCFVPTGTVHITLSTFTTTFVRQLFQPTEVAPLDHFTCYKTAAAKAPRGAAPYPKFAPTTVTAVDRFTTSEPNDQGRLDLKKPLVVCNPSDKNGEDPTAPDHAAHLEGYAAKITKTDPKQPKPAKSVRAITNQLGPLSLQISKPDSLLVPSAKVPGDGGATPLGPTGVDHFKCYKAKVAKAKRGEPILPVFTRTTVAVTDQFGGPRTFDLKKPTRLCAPANKNGEDPAAPSHPDHLVCYQAKLAKQTPKQPKLVPQVVSTTNQFGAEVVRAKSLVELCVPSTATD